MISDQLLLRLLRSETVVRRDGSAIRLLIIGAVLGMIGVWLIYYRALARTMAAELNFNDFGKFYYSAQLFLNGQNMYGPSPATEMVVAGGAIQSFLNMNPPHFHLPLLPLAAMSASAAAAVWTIASLLALGFSLHLIAKELVIRITWRRVLWGVLAALMFSATGAVVATGQVTFLMLPFVTLAWRASRHGAWSKAGALLGLLMSIKPFLLVFLPFFILKRRWGALISATMVIGWSYLIGLAVFGIEMHLEWIQALDAADWNWAAMNGSLLGILSRTLADSPYYTPAAQVPDLIQPIWLASALVVGTLTLLAASFDQSRDSVDRAFFLLLVGALLVSPLGWVYYLWLPLAPAIALQRRSQVSDPGKIMGPARWRNVSLVLAIPGLVWPHVVILVGQPSPWATITIGSFYFWAMLFLWGTVVIDSCAARREARVQPEVGDEEAFGTETPENHIRNIERPRSGRHSSSGRRQTCKVQSPVKIRGR